MIDLILRLHIRKFGQERIHLGPNSLAYDGSRLIISLSGWLFFRRLRLACGLSLAINARIFLLFASLIRFGLLFLPFLKQDSGNFAFEINQVLVETPLFFILPDSCSFSLSSQIFGGFYEANTTTRRWIVRFLFGQWRHFNAQNLAQNLGVGNQLLQSFGLFVEIGLTVLENLAALDIRFRIPATLGSQCSLIADNMRLDVLQVTVQNTFEAALGFLRGKREIVLCSILCAVRGLRCRRSCSGSVHFNRLPTLFHALHSQDIPAKALDE